jgi:ferredoxin
MIKCKSPGNLIMVLTLLSVVIITIVSCSDNVDKVRVTGNNIASMSQVVIDYNLCGGCDSCFARCPVKAVSKTSLDNSPVYLIDPQKCIRCGICIKVCPFNAISWKH